jgi:kynureninase
MLKFEKNDQADFNIYSDRSGFNKGIGAAAILYAKNRHTPVSQLKKYIGPKAKNNTYEAETIGAILGTWLISNCLDSVRKNISLYIGNQAVIQAAKNTRTVSDPSSHLLH